MCVYVHAFAHICVCCGMHMGMCLCMSCRPDAISTAQENALRNDKEMQRLIAMEKRSAGKTSGKKRNVSPPSLEHPDKIQIPTSTYTQAVSAQEAGSDDKEGAYASFFGAEVDVPGLEVLGKRIEAATGDAKADPSVQIPYTQASKEVKRVGSEKKEVRVCICVYLYLYLCVIVDVHYIYHTLHLSLLHFTTYYATQGSVFRVLQKHSLPEQEGECGERRHRSVCQGQCGQGERKAARCVCVCV
jgi:hypothetical protein